ncbi:histidine triad nucleotide-binding protein 1-like isoform X2 [Ischnura elegans]|uniref:histidine triad nucleotide-binding protein 1-like isoform X2 n=1 Tax=Ischnura elegans TaxID=197161 RepID=UPI001ED88CA0|nr:histidine triad nucleotide-binding protein 1-like isoform X2 [Ischnura elegans]
MLSLIFRSFKNTPSTSIRSRIYCNEYRIKGFPVNRAISSEVEKAQTAAKNPDTVTIFDKILSKEIPADIIYEDDQCLAFNDVNPQAPIHFLVIPKKKISMLEKCDSSNKELLGHLLCTAAEIARTKLKNGYRVDGPVLTDSCAINSLGTVVVQTWSEWN